MPPPLPRHRLLLSILLLTTSSYHQCFCSAASSPSGRSATTSTKKSSGRDVIFASPLKTLTIYDKMTTSSSDGDTFLTPRARFLKKFKGGMESEKKERLAILAEEKNRKKREEDGELVPFPADDDTEGEYFQSSEWAEVSEAAESAARAQKERRLRGAFAAGFNSVRDPPPRSTPSPKSGNRYQFVGVVSPRGNGSNVKWFAREKPRGAEWSVRLVHVDKGAMLRDLFVRGKIDIYAKYENKGIPVPMTDEKESGGVEKKGAVIVPKYTIKERSWKTLWNFSPKHFFTDRSGMFWRERRIRPGVYTDGQNVYESTYRYMEGKNGMTQLPGVDLSSYLEKYAPEEEERNKILERVTKGSPDVVAEN